MSSREPLPRLEVSIAFVITVARLCRKFLHYDKRRRLNYVLKLCGRHKGIEILVFSIAGGLDETRKLYDGFVNFH